MIPSQNNRIRVALNGTVSTSALTYGPRVDCAGADSATFVVHLEATNATGTNGLISIVLEESDVTTTANFATITGFNYTATQITAATAASDITAAASGPVAVLSTSLVGRKRFIRIGARGHSSATAAIKVQSICILDALGVAGTAPSGATVNVFAP